jgi:foldase protein PrsA
MDRKLLTIGIAIFAGTCMAVLLLGGRLGCGRSDETLAYVNGEPIRLSDFYQYLQHKADVSVITANGTASFKVNGSLGSQAFRDMVSQQLELQIARDKGLYPTQDELENELNAKLHANPAYVLDLVSQGISLELIKKSITIDLAQEKLLTQGVTYTEEQTKAYMRLHTKDFIQPERVDLSIIFLRDRSKCEQADGDLNSGQSFSNVALRYSEQPDTRELNGHLTEPGAELPAVANLPAEIRNGIRGLSEHQTSSWISSGGGFCKLYVNKLVPAAAIPMDDAKIDLLRRALAKQAGAKRINLEKLIADKLRTSKVSVVLPAYREAWKSLAN